MRENSEKLHKETDAAFAFATILLNLLILLVLCGVFRLMQFVLTQNVSLDALFRDYPGF
ncbi:MAG: hypothetical protein WA584_18585 [Pyrinomonadaceae bacterium]